LYCILG